MNINQIISEAIQYTDGVLELDPIGASDLRTDFANYVQMLYQTHRYTDVKSAWTQFNHDVVKPVYKINIPAK